jgi:CelD/BcsL family acetyltransferase involved in cellulose biosynthesis
MLRVDEIISKTRFQSLHAEWNDLLEKSGQYSPFLAHEWFGCCLAGYGGTKDIFILLVSEGSRVVGIAPLWRYQDSARGISVRKAGFITTPDTPFVDFIIHREHRYEVFRTLVDHLCTERKDTWDMLTLNQWPVESPNYRALHETLRKEHKGFFMGFSSITPYIPRRGEWEAFLQTRSSRFRKTHRNIVNRIGKLKSVEVQCFRQDATGAVLKDILAVSERSWKHKNGVAIASTNEAKMFFEKLTDIAGQKGWLLAWLLKVDDVPIAMEYDLEHSGIVYALRADFDDAYSDYSPGAYLEYQIIKRLFEQGYLEYHTGPGLNAYKLNWTDEFKENVILHLCNNNLKGWIIWALEDRLIPRLKWVRNLGIQISPKK